jgi:hypothetical protein
MRVMIATAIGLGAVSSSRARVLVSVVAFCIWVLVSLGFVASAAAQPQPDKVSIVAVIGCLAEQGADNWMLTSATEPVPSLANAPPANQPVTGPTSGKNQFKLIGVSEFNLPAHRGHTILVKALFIKAAPVARLNVTSVTMVSATCSAPSK